MSDAPSPSCRGSGEPALLVRGAGGRTPLPGQPQLLREFDDHTVLTSTVATWLRLSPTGSVARSPDDPVVDSVATSTGRPQLSG